TDYDSTYVEYQKVKKAYDKWQSSEQELAQRMDMLVYQTNDIELAELVSGEEEALIEEKNLLVNYQRIVGALSVSYDALQGEEGSGVDL
ncbi:hypothetical protein O6471_24405, partial [Salmonella enterica subsp. enterica]